MKSSYYKNLIFEAVHSSRNHPTADEIFATLKESGENIGLATVYRNLNTLAADGRIKKIVGADGAHFDRADFPHGHFICSSCGKICDFSPDFEDNIFKTASKFGFSGNLDISISGLCENCAVAGTN